MTVGTKDTTTDVTDVTTVTDITALTISFDQLTPPDPNFGRNGIGYKCNARLKLVIHRGDTYQPFNMNA